MQAETLITEHLDLWTSAVKPKKAAGRGRGKGSSRKRELYGLKKLRELILELAVRGQLVPQDPNDEPASALLERIAAEKARLIAEKKIKKQKALPPITDDEKPFDLPQGWEWVSLSHLGIFSGGKTPSKMKSEYWGGNIPWVTPKDMKVTAVYDSEDHVTHLAVNDGLSLVEPESLFFVVRSGILRRAFPVAVTKVQATVNQDLKVLSLVDSSIAGYVLLMMQGYEQYILQNLSKTGTTVESIKFDEFSKHYFMIPPLAEQHRIVAKVDELMQLCDQLEQTTETNLDAHQTLVENLLAALVRPSPQPLQRGATPRKAGEGLKDTASCSPSPVQRERGLGGEGNVWQRIATHFDTLFTTEHSIDQLKQTILQLAVMGKLVPQDPNDEPASVLLEKIAAEKAQLIAEKKIKKQKALPPIGEDEKPFALPEGWEWCRFFAVNTVKSELVKALEFPLEKQIAPDSIEKDTGKLLQHRTVEQAGAKEPNNRFYENQLLYSKIRPSLNKVVIAPYDGLCSADMYPIDCHVNNDFMLKTMLSEIFLVQVRRAENRVKMPKLNLDSLGGFLVPIAPLAEQQRIVAKVDELMALCDQLKTRLNTAQQTQWQLADAVAQVS